MDSQGVICCCLDGGSVQDTILSLLETASNQFEINNKYYKATIQLLDYEDNNKADNKQKLEDCHAIILYGTTKTTTGQLDEKLEEFRSVGGEPRVLLYDGPEDEPTSLQGWCIKNGYDFINSNGDDARTELIDSLSAYKWPHRSENNMPKLNDELVKKLMDFDSLLGKLSAYRDKPELRGDPDDKNIVEIAEILSGLLGDDLDDFLDSDTDADHTDSTTNTTNNNETSVVAE